MSPFLMNTAGCLIIILVNQQLIRHGGLLAVGAYGIVNRITFLFVTIVMGLNHGMQPIAGYNYGANLLDRVMEVLKKSIFYATIIMTVGFVVVELFPHAVAGIFTTEEQLVSIAVQGLRWVFAVYPLIGFQVVCSAYFQSIGKPKKSIILAMIRQVFLLIPFLLIFPNFWRIKGVWISVCVSDALSVVLAAILLYGELKTKNKRI
jgi:Na+-driven multidrug efflux pump